MALISDPFNIVTNEAVPLGVVLHRNDLIHGFDMWCVFCGEAITEFTFGEVRGVNALAFKGWLERLRDQHYAHCRVAKNPHSPERGVRTIHFRKRR